MKNLILICLCCSFGWIVNTVTGKENLVKNSQFIKFSRNGIPTSWNRYCRQEAGCRIKPLKKILGQKGAVALIDNSSSHENGIVQTIPVTESGWYELSVNAAPLDSSGAGQLFAQVFFLPGKKKTQEMLNAEYGKILNTTFYAKAPRGTKKLKIFLYSHRKPLANIAVTDISLKKVSKPRFTLNMKNPCLDGLPGKNQYPYGWSLYGKLSPDCYLQKTVVGRGQGLYIYDNSVKGEIGITQQFRAQADLVYSCSIKAKRIDFDSTDAAYLQMRFLPANKVKQIPLNANSKDFEKYTVSAKAPEGTEFIRLFIYTHKKAKSKIMVKNVNIKTVDDKVAFGKLKKLYLDTVLVDNGRKKALIVIPENDYYRQEAKRIQEAVFSKSGVHLDIVDDSQEKIGSKLKQNLILLGNRNTNKVISSLYDRYYTLLDLRYPGKNGYVVRSLHNPLGDGHNVIFIGGSDDFGVNAATKKFVEVIGANSFASRKLQLGHLAKIKLGKDIKVPAKWTDVKNWEASAGYGTAGYFGWNSLSKLMALFYMTNDEKYLNEFLRLAFPDKKTSLELAKLDGEMIEDKSRPLSAPYHYSAHLTIIYWDLIEENPLLNDQQRKKITKALVEQFKYFRDVPRAGRNIYYLCDNPAQKVGDRHEQWCALAIYALCRYFDKYYPCEAYAKGIKVAENFFAPLKNGIPWLEGEGGNLFWYTTSINPAFVWTLLSNSRSKSSLKTLEKLFHRLEILTSWEKHDWTLKYGSLNFYNKAAYLLNSSAPLKMRDLTGVSTKDFRIGQSFWPDENLQSSPIEKLAGKFYVARPCKNELKQWRPPFPVRQAFNYASFYKEYKKQNNFVLVAGKYVRNARNPYHCFATVEQILKGERILFGYRNQLQVYADGLVSPLQAEYTALKSQGAIEDLCFLHCSVPEYNYTNWKRTIVQKMNHFALYIDEVVANKNIRNTEIKLSWEPAPEKCAKIGSSGTLVLEGGAKKLFVLKGRGLKPETSSDDVIAKHLGAFEIWILKGRKKGDFMRIPFVLPKPVSANLNIKLLGYKDRASVDIILDGKVLLKSFAHRTENVQNQSLSLGYQTLSAGKHYIELRIAENPPVEAHGYAIAGFSELSFTEDNKMNKKEILLCSSEALATESQNFLRDFWTGATGKTFNMTWNGALKKNTSKTLFTLVSFSKNKEPNCMTVAPNAALLTLPEKTLAVTGNYEDIEGKVALLSSSSLCGFELSRCGDFFNAEHPVNFKWDFVSQKLTVECRRKTKISLNRKELVLEKGVHNINNIVPKTAVLTEIKDKLNELHSKFYPQRKICQKDKTWKKKFMNLPNFKADWSCDTNKFITALVPLVVNNQQRYIVASGNKIYQFDTNGKTLKVINAGSLVRVLHWWPEPKLIIAGCLNEKVIAFDTDGSKRWEFVSQMHPEVKKTGKYYWFRSAPGHQGIRGLASGKFMNNQEQLFVGSACTVELLDPSGKLVKRIRQWWGPSDQFQMIKGPDGNNIMLVGRSYNGFHHVALLDSRDPKFNVRGFYSVPFGASMITGWQGLNRGHILYEDLDGNGQKEIISDINGIFNRITVWNNKGKALWDACLGAGPAIAQPSAQPAIPQMMMRDMAVADLNKDGKKEIIIITAKKLLLIFNHKLKLKQSLRLPSEPMLVQAADKSMFVACRDGKIYEISPETELIQKTKVEGIPVKSAWVKGRLLIGTNTGKFYCFSVERR